MKQNNEATAMEFLASILDKPEYENTYSIMVGYHTYLSTPSPSDAELAEEILEQYMPSITKSEIIEAMHRFAQSGKELTGWVSVESNVLPDNGQYVLIYTKTEGNSPTNHIISQYLDEYGFISAANVTHWMPLPNPPKQ